MKPEEKKKAREILRKIGELYEMLEIRHDGYVEEDKEYTPTAERCEEEMGDIEDAGNTIAELIGADFEDYKYQNE